MNAWIEDQAFRLKNVIEARAPGGVVGLETQELVRRLGGNADVSQMKPDEAALYLIALVLIAPTGG